MQGYKSQYFWHPPNTVAPRFNTTVKAGTKRTPYKKPYTKKNPYMAKKKKTTVKKQLKELKKAVNADNATHVHKRRDPQRVLAQDYETEHSSLIGINATTLETAMANLRYYNPATPGTLTTADASTGTYSRGVHFKSIFSKLTVRNNYQISAKVTIYSCTPRADTNSTPIAFYATGISDQCITGNTTDPLLYLNDINMVKDIWHCKRVKQVLLNPGRECYAYHKAKPFDYDPSLYDSHTLLYQSKFKAHVFVVRVDGVIGHDTSSNEQAQLKAGVDTFVDHVFTMVYDAGVNLHDISQDNNQDTFTNSGVASNMPVADNQSYSAN